MNFTENQQNAIDVRDCSLIVSAGAGSGKTAVLTERILERICDERDDCNINDFLIVTFTNAAAKELSDRIRKKLSERAVGNPGNKKIIKNLALLPLAKISTINSFCYEIVRENFQRLGLSASVRIADDTEIAVIREKIMNEVINEYFEEKGDNEEFLAAYEVFSSSKKDEGFIGALLSLDLQLSNVADRDGFCKSVIEGYDSISSGKEFFDTFFGRELKNYIKDGTEKMMRVFDKLMQDCGKYEILTDKYLPVIEHEYEFSRELYHACDDGYETVYKLVNEHKIKTFAGRNIPSDFENLALKNSISETKKTAGDNFLKSVKELCCCSPELLCLAAKDTGMIISKLFELTDIFRKKFTDRKNELSVIDFSDAERYTLSLLVDNFSPFEVTDLATEMRNKFKEIYIDEYQDVNPLQDMIFKAISRHDIKGEYNRFMVGDIKQSIYGFRGARSDIFLSYRNSFCDIAEDGNAKRIFMSDNFRCCESVIAVTNIVFKKLMDSYYTDSDSLRFSRIENNKVSHKVKMLAFNYDKETADGVTSPELEAAMICGKIREFVNNPLYTDSEGRMYKYSDVCILSKAKATLKVYENVFNRFGIPTVCEVGESFYGKKEIILCINILSSIDNPERDIYLAGFMRSFAGGFSDDELAVLKKEYKDMSLYRSLVNCSENGSRFDEKLGEKCSEFIAKLREYRHFSRGKSADKLLWKIYTDMDLLNMCCSDYFTNDKKATRKNLLKLYDMARAFSKTSFRGVGAFVDYINGSIAKGDVKAERDSAGNCVTLMTIHKSKGLEFPICFVTNLSGTRHADKLKYVFSDKGGVAVFLKDTEAVVSMKTDTGLVTASTPFVSLVKQCNERELLAEEMRVLYVAMTRARDILVLTSCLSKKIENTMAEIELCGYSGDFGSLGNSFSRILASLSGDAALKPFYDAAGMDQNVTNNYAENYLECEYVRCEDIKDAFDNYARQAVFSETWDDNAIDIELEKALNAFPEHYIPGIIPSKITVSQLKKGLIDEEKMAGRVVYGETPDEGYTEPLPLFVQDEDVSDGAAKGTAMHMFMQFCDFEKCENGCESEADRLFEEGFIDKKQREILSIEKLDEFFATEFYKTVRNSRNIYREQRFNLMADAFDTSVTGEILVQGVIDLFYENDDGTFTVVDFKTDRVFGDGAEDVLVERHKDQLMYYKRAVEEMTEREVKHTYIYSFSLMKEIEVD